MTDASTFEDKYNVVLHESFNGNFSKEDNITLQRIENIFKLAQGGDVIRSMLHTAIREALHPDMLEKTETLNWHPAVEYLNGKFQYLLDDLEMLADEFEFKRAVEGYQYIRTSLALTKK